jgi:ATP-binding cassette, subfamily B, bacterial CvaB/MchF/RaxB
MRTKPTSPLSFGWGRRTPMLLQTENAECALACLGMVAAHHGFKATLGELRQRIGVSQQGATLAHLIGMARRLGLEGRPLKLELNELAQLRRPCILHWDMGHFVVLVQANARHITILDPAVGERRLSLAEVGRHFTGIALELTPTIEFKARAAGPRVHLRDLMGRVTGLKRSVAQVLVLCLAIEVFALLTPLVTQLVVDQALVTADRNLLATLAIAFLVLLVLREAFSTVRGWLLVVLGSTLNLQWSSNVFGHLMRLPMPFFERRHLGDVVSRFGSIQVIQRTITTSFIEVMLDGLMSVAALTMLVIYSPPLAAIAVLAVGLYVLVRAAFHGPLRRHTEEQIVHAARQQGQLLESIRGVQSLKLHGREELRRVDYSNLAVKTLNREIATHRLGLAFRASNGVLRGAENVLILWLGALLVLDQKLSVGMLLAFVAYNDQFLQRVSALIDKFIELRMLNLQSERLSDIVLTPIEELGGDETAMAHTPPSTPASMQLQDVRFRYCSSDAWVLYGVTMEVRAGESLAIVGASGCGKTTLMKLMLGLLEPEAGALSVDGQPIVKFGMRTWRQQIGVVMQDDQMFAGSIADNIACFDASIDMVAVRAAADWAAIADDIEAMPMKYNTLIGDMGAALSGGQRQRILLARALYRKPRILFLDEATSHLDVQRERQVCEAIRRLAITRVVIAHRPETIASADRVIVLRDGKVHQSLEQYRSAEAQAERAAAQSG